MANEILQEHTLLSLQGRMHRRRHAATLLLTLTGEHRVDHAGGITHMHTNDVLLLEPDSDFTVMASGSNLLLLLQLEFGAFTSPVTGGSGRFVCNSAEDGERDYTALRRLLAQLSLNRCEAASYWQLREQELCSALLYYLYRSHYVPEPGGGKHEERCRRILAYLESNYMHELSLEELAEANYLSPSYLSRFFKQHIGVNFKTYLQDLRLQHAAEQLRAGGQTVTAVAYNNGFPNVGALSSAVRKKYGVAPTELRGTAGKPQEPAQPEEYRLVDYGTAQQSLQAMAADAPGAPAERPHYPAELEYCVENAAQFQAIQPIWKTMINLGGLRNLGSTGMQAQMETAQREIGFQYARIQGVLQEEAIPSLPGGHYNFSQLDRVIESLLALKLTPFLDLSFRSDYLFLSRSEIVHRDRPEAQRREGDELARISALLRHCINTFGSGEVERWGVEISVSHSELLECLETPEEYAARFEAAYRLIKSLLPGLLVGGPGYNIAMGPDFLERTVALLRTRQAVPDFLSLCAFPYEPTQAADPAARFVISSDPDYIRRQIAYFHRRFAGEDGVPLWLTVLGPDIRSRNHVNDSCYQASFLVKNTLDLIGLVDVIGYWQLSDLGAEYIDTTRILFGGTGLISKDGLKKPGFTALKRLAGVNSLLLRREDCLLVTTNAINTYNLVLCNYTHFDELYCLSGGENVTCENTYGVFRETATRDVTVRLGGLAPGRYKVITTTLNREAGSLFDAWLRYGILDDLQPRDLQYLQDIVHPHRAARYQDCPDGELRLRLQLLPHELKFLSVLREL